MSFEVIYFGRKSLIENNLLYGLEYLRLAFRLNCLKSLVSNRVQLREGFVDLGNEPSLVYTGRAIKIEWGNLYRLEE